MKTQAPFPGPVDRRSVVGGLAATLPFALAGRAESAQVMRAGPRFDPEALRLLLRTEAERAGTRAVICGVWSGSSEILVEALGTSTQGVPATPDMHYRIGGITETFMVTLLFMLADERRIDLDAKISLWFPTLLAADQVTPRMLAANTAGYLDYVKDKAWLKRLLANPFAPFSDVELIHYAVRGGRMNYAPPGSGWAYSHTEYVILGQVIQRATGQSIQSLYERYLLGPLRLRDTRLPPDAAIQRPALHAYMLDRGGYEDSTNWTPSWAYSYGGLTSSVRDLGQWGRIFGNGRLLSRRSFREMISPGAARLKANPPPVYFAHGFVVANGWYVQNPDFNGYAGAFAYNPARDLTIVIVSTKNERPIIDPAAIHILKTMVAKITPESPVNF